MGAVAKRNRTSRERDEHTEFATAAGKQASPALTYTVLIIAAGLSLALCALNIGMSLLAAQFMQPMQQLGVPNGQLIGMWFMASAGWLMTAAAIIVYWIALTRKTNRKRIRWSIAAVVVSALFPLSWLLFYI